MKTVLCVLAIIFSVSIVTAAEPDFNLVGSKTSVKVEFPIFVGSQKISEYKKVLDKVMKGEKVVLVVGKKTKLPKDKDYFVVDSMVELEDGVYDCFLEADGPKAKIRQELITDDDHTCNKCGASQYVHNKTNADGSHSHKCSKCGHEWWHGGPLGYFNNQKIQTPITNPHQFSLYSSSTTSGGG